MSPDHYLPLSVRLSAGQQRRRLARLARRRARGLVRPSAAGAPRVRWFDRVRAMGRRVWQQLRRSNVEAAIALAVDVQRRQAAIARRVSPHRCTFRRAVHVGPGVSVPGPVCRGKLRPVNKARTRWQCQTCARTVEVAA